MFLKYKSKIVDIISYFGASLLPMLLNLLINPLISLNMNPEDFAIVGYYTSFNALITPIIGFYFVQYYIKRYFELDIEERKRLKASVFKSLIWFSLTATIICLIGIYIYIRCFTTDFSLPVFPYLIMSIFTVPLTGIYNLQLADYKMNRESKRYLSLSLFYGCLIVAFNLLYVVMLKGGAFGKLLSPLCVNIIFFVYLLWKNKDLIIINTTFADFKRSFTFCAPLALGASLGYFTNGYDRTYLETLNQPIEFGYYVVGASIATYLTTFSSAISTTFQPDIYESITRHDNRRLYKIFALQVFLIVIVTILFIILCPFLVKILTAGKYILSTNYARILSIATITSTLYYNVNCISIAKGYPILYMITTICGSLVIICLLPTFISRWQFMGGAYMTIFSYVIFFVINTIMLAFVLYINKTKIHAR